MAARLAPHQVHQQLLHINRSCSPWVVLVSHTESSADGLPPGGHALLGVQAWGHPASHHHHHLHHHHCCCVHPAFAAVGDPDSLTAAPALAGLHLLLHPSAETAAAAVAACPCEAAAVACCCCAGHVETWGTAARADLCTLTIVQEKPIGSQCIIGTITSKVLSIEQDQQRTREPQDACALAQPALSAF